jgi:hypothetical protein
MSKSKLQKSGARTLSVVAAPPPVPGDRCCHRIGLGALITSAHTILPSLASLEVFTYWGEKF